MPIYADPCPPNDPEGLNPSTLCNKDYTNILPIKYQTYGVGSSAYYGPAIDINTPGTKIINTPLASDFFTSVEVGDISDGIRLTTNSGKTFHIQKQ